MATAAETPAAAENEDGTALEVVPSDVPDLAECFYARVLVEDAVCTTEIGPFATREEAIEAATTDTTVSFEITTRFER